MYRNVESLCCTPETNIAWCIKCIFFKFKINNMPRGIFWGGNVPPTSTPVLVKVLFFYPAVGIRA